MAKLVVLVLVLQLMSLPVVSFGIALKVMSFAFSTVDFLQSQLNSEESVSEASIENLKQEILKRIEAANTKVLTSVLLQLKFDKVETAVKITHSSLVDLQNVITTNSKAEAQQYMRIYLKNFDDNSVLVELRWLQHMLTYTVQGGQTALLDLFVTSNRCNMTAMEVFEEFYMTHMSNGAALHFAYTVASFPNTSLDTETEEWNTTIKEVQDQFNTWKLSCRRQFLTLARQDFFNGDDPEVLWKNNQLRYPWMWMDDIFFDDVGTFQFRYHRNWIDTAFWQQTNGKNKYQVFGEAKDVSLWNATNIRLELEAHRPYIANTVFDEEDNDAAKKIADYIRTNLEAKGFSIRNIIVFFESGEYPIEKILIHEDSPVVNVSIPDVTIRYCFSNQAACDLKIHEETSTGNFQVFVYPGNADNEPSTIFVGRGSLQQMSRIVLLIPLFIERFV